MLDVIKRLIRSVGPYVLGITIGVGFAAMLLSVFADRKGGGGWMPSDWAAWLGSPDKASASPAGGAPAKPPLKSAVAGVSPPMTTSPSTGGPVDFSFGQGWKSVEVEPSGKGAAGLAPPVRVETPVTPSAKGEGGRPADPAPPAEVKGSVARSAPAEAKRSAPEGEGAKKPDGSVATATGSVPGASREAKKPSAESAPAVVAARAPSEPPVVAPHAGKSPGSSGDREGMPPALPFMGNHPAWSGAPGPPVAGCVPPSGPNAYVVNQYYACFWRQTCVNRVNAARMMIERGKAQCPTGGANARQCQDYYQSLESQYRLEMCDQWNTH